jgi:hypothetical protein
MVVWLETLHINFVQDRLVVRNRGLEGILADRKPFHLLRNTRASSDFLRFGCMAANDRQVTDLVDDERREATELADSLQGAPERSALQPPV